MPSSPNTLQTLSGPLEVKFKGGTFATWSDSFVRLEGRWLCLYKRERDANRQGAVEIGPGVNVTDITNPEASAKFPRRFDVSCSGGLLPRTELSLRTKSRKDRDLWVLAIANNLRCLSSPRGQDPHFGIRELAPVALKLRQGLKLHPIRIRSDLTVRCATGEAIVAFLVDNGVVQDKVTASGLCRQLLSMNLLHHVMWTHDFIESPEPYVIVALEDNVDTQVDSTAGDDYQIAHFLKYMDSPTSSITRVLRQFSNMAAIASQCPVAIIGLLDSETYVMGAQYGINLDAAVPRQQSFAAHTCRSGSALVCSDLTRDVRFVGNPWRQKQLKNAAFYAGIPLILSNGHAVGALEVFGSNPRYECTEVLGQLQAVVRGLLNLFEEVMSAAAQAQLEEQQEREAQTAVEKQAQEEAAKEQQAKSDKPPNAMEAQLLQLLSQTTTTQEQLRAQQGQMVSAISSHSKQIDNLAKQLERIEATLAAKLDSTSPAE
ncbi:hypothetical protein BBJ29_005436 [Phytophthora kernoviae]|uniref:PH domain-containing protein n=1 Tax=Phytophthora kernoviae TaxID=325452 RepID=A0A3F2RTJ2_9STRA|nr:hypothetical protein BBJ29_005436 [Phytophthora kernoviae]RLN63961.1 hypothetical protein BBP00_00003748 [Phytophthora kernoviae]